MSFYRLSLRKFLQKYTMIVSLCSSQKSIIVMVFPTLNFFYFLQEQASHELCEYHFPFFFCQKTLNCTLCAAILSFVYFFFIFFSLQRTATFWILFQSFTDLNFVSFPSWVSWYVHSDWNVAKHTQKFVYLISTNIIQTICSKETQSFSLDSLFLSDLCTAFL